jgi:hypothetical protein
MTELEILKWNVDMGNTTSGGRNVLIPYAMIQPDLKWLAQAKANDNIVYVEITDSGIYDGGYRAILEPTSFIPNPRPNFFAATQTYALTLVDADWSGYPPNGALGKVKLSDAVVVPGEGYITPKPGSQEDFDKAVGILSKELTNKHGNSDADTDTPPPAPENTSTPWYVWLIVGVICLIVILSIILAIVRPGRVRVGVGLPMRPPRPFGPPPPRPFGPPPRPGININL